MTLKQTELAGGFIFLCSPILGEMIPVLINIFQLGWFNHQLDRGSCERSSSWRIALRLLSNMHKIAMQTSTLTFNMAVAALAAWNQNNFQTEHGVDMYIFCLI